MNILQSLDKADADTNYEVYEKIYSTRHNFPIEWIRQHPKLQLAAQLEWQVANQIISVHYARRQFVEQYPESNRAPVGRTIIESYGYVHQDKEYAKGSVISLIEPYDDSIREL